MFPLVVATSRKAEKSSRRKSHVTGIPEVVPVLLLPRVDEFLLRRRRLGAQLLAAHLQQELVVVRWAVPPARGEERCAAGRSNFGQPSPLP